MARSEVRIIVAGVDYPVAAYQIESNMLQGADAFGVSLPNPGGVLAGKFAPFDAVQVVLDDTVQMTGFIDEVNESGSPGSGATIELVGRDKFGQLVDHCPEPGQISGLDLAQVAAKLSDPFGIDWIFDNEENRSKLQIARAKYARLDKQAKQDKAEYERQTLLSRLTVGNSVNALNETRLEKLKANLAAIKLVVFPRIKVEPGDRVLDVLQKYAKKTGFMIWQAADGAGIIAKPSYNANPSYQICLFPPSHHDRHRNNVRSYNHTARGADRYATYRAIGYSGNTSTTSGKGSRHDLTETDAGVPLARHLVIGGGGGQNRKQAKEELSRQRQQAEFDSDVLSYTMGGHTQSELLWQVDTIASVEDRMTNRTGSWFITRRRFEGTMNGGQTTELTLHRPNVLLP